MSRRHQPCAVITAGLPTNKRAAIRRGPFASTGRTTHQTSRSPLDRSIVAFRIESWKQDLGKAEFREIRDAHGIKLADQVIAFVLHDARVKPLRKPFYRRAI